MIDQIKALIPAAGRGKRLASVSGGGPKELVTVGPLTMIEHCLTMVSDSGVTEVGLVIHPDKEAVRRTAELFWAKHVPSAPELTFIYQDPPLGVADAMRLATDFADEVPLAVIMPDNLLLGGPPALAQILRGFRDSGQYTMGVIPLPAARAPLFGNVGRVELEDDRAVGPVRVKSFSPKLPGDLAAGGDLVFKGLTGVIYLPGWAAMIDDLSPNLEGEIDDTDLVMRLVREGRLLAVVLEGLGFDLGHEKGLAAARQYLIAGRVTVQ